MDPTAKSYILKGLCPCGCKNPIEHNHFWASDTCRRRNRNRVHMPVRLERKRLNALRKIQS